MEIVDGPAKADLRKALANPERERAVFRTSSDTLSVRIDRLEQSQDGDDFTVYGVVYGGAHDGLPFEAFYTTGGRTGRFEVGSKPSGERERARVQR
jgi:hypothetical protein